MKLTPLHEIIPEKNIIILSPHYDDVLFMLGGYILELKNAGMLKTKSFAAKLIFSRSNYQAREGNANFDTSVQRIKHATGIRMIEDQICNDALLGSFNYQYELLGETECFARGKTMADSEMEFPHGMYDDFDSKDEAIFERMKQQIRKYASFSDTAIVFPLAIKEHIDHFIVREAGIKVAQELGSEAKASFYFQEDKPYGGLANGKELSRTEGFISKYDLQQHFYAYDPEKVVDLAFEHYISQVEEVYRTGVLARARFWQQQLAVEKGVDRICKYRPE